MILGDGINDILVGKESDYLYTEGVFVIFLNSGGFASSHYKISTDGAGDFTASLSSGLGFGLSTAIIGDVNQDEVPDLMLGARFDNSLGAAFVVFSNPANGQSHNIHK